MSWLVNSLTKNSVAGDSVQRHAVMREMVIEATKIRLVHPDEITYKEDPSDIISENLNSKTRSRVSAVDKQVKFYV